MTLRRAGGAAALVAVLAAPGPAGAADFRSVGAAAAIFYDAPSAKARRAYVVGRLYPVDVVVRVGDWTKIRDPSGELFWVEATALSDRRTVVVTSPTAEIRESADDRSAPVFTAEKGVILEVAEPGPANWIKVRHRDGAAGFVRTDQIWGA